jgi:hypothetical protein
MTSLAAHARQLRRLPPGIGVYRASVRKTGYCLDLWLFFKTVRPASKVIARAQDELDRLRLPS